MDADDVPGVTPNENIDVDGIALKGGFVVTGVVVLLCPSLVVGADDVPGVTPNEKLGAGELVLNDAFVVTGA